MIELCIELSFELQNYNIFDPNSNTGNLVFFFFLIYIFVQVNVKYFETIKLHARIVHDGNNKFKAILQIFRFHLHRYCRNNSVTFPDTRQKGKKFN